MERASAYSMTLRSRFALSSMTAASAVRRIVDLDVHQGNGTNAIFAGDDSVYTFSMHGRRNYPFAKVPGSLDVDLEDGTDDDAYLAALNGALPRVIAESRADVIVYLAGADAHENDRLGRLRLTQAGLARRDVIVLRAAREVGIPVVIAIAGGYGRDPETTVAIHAEAARLAAEFAGAGSASV
jgi:acetoin utilization deacetylase AcuC-like enzyme